MYNKDELCAKIMKVYPEIGQCGIDVTVGYSEEKKAYIVDLKKDKHELTTHLDPEDADACMLGKQCVGLAMQVVQLKKNIEEA